MSCLPRFRRLAGCCLWLAGIFIGQSSIDPHAGFAEVNGQPDVRFNADIRPILSDACFACHGPDANARESELRLDTQAGMFADLGGYRAVVPGDPEESLLLQRILSDDESEQMPPPESHKSLDAEQIEKIRQWIEQGADYQEHWAFESPVRPPVPRLDESAEGALDDDWRGWPANEIDEFVAARLRSSGLTPSREVEREILIRRVTLDLTGLPPSLQDVDTFVRDASSSAYENLVDRLLQSEHYGEHMARYWLDAARYGDTHGLHLDNYREMWPYRDWVVNAFNRNMPFDQFVIEQLAGDLLPEPTLSQQIATGFNRAHVTTNEGGTIPEEFYVRNVVDRVDTTGQVFMGLTLGCAVCHDHKYDPISQKEYYQLFAFFNSIDGSPMDGNVKDHAPFVRVPSDEQRRRQRELIAAREDLEAVHARRGEEVELAFRSWMEWQKQLLATGSRISLPLAEIGKPQQAYTLDGIGDQERGASGRGRQAAIVHGQVVAVKGKLGAAVEFQDAEAFVDLGDVAKLKKSEPFSFGGWVRTSGQVKAAFIAKMNEENASGYSLELDHRKVRLILARSAPDLSMTVVTQADVVSPDQWQHVFVTYDGSQKAAGISVYVDGKAQKVVVESDQLGKYDFNTGKPLWLGRRAGQESLIGGAVDDIRFYDRALSPSDVAQLALADEIEALLVLPQSQLEVADINKLREYYLTQFDTVYAEQLAEIQSLRDQESELKKQMPTTLVFKERQQPRPAFVLERGEYDHQAEEVSRDTPAILPPFDSSLPRNRLGLAQWLVSEEHPLLARVTVNRFWQQLFGTGIVKTAEDFGSQGEPPSHPELLDWLAVDFRENAWDVKRLMKMLVMSKAYRQSSKVTPELLKIDPSNRLLARGPRFRLDAEMLRDQALAVSGLLVSDLGGPSVKPPQPDGLWFAVGYSGSNTVRFKADSEGDKVHRRTLYTFIKRTAPPPQMSTFDAPSREACVLRRERTNTPLQALLLLNDSQYFEAAKALAARVLRDDAANDREKLARMYRLSTSRTPNESVLEELYGLLQDERAAYADDLSAAEELIDVGAAVVHSKTDPRELAAWTMVANIVLNLDEVLCKN